MVFREAISGSYLKIPISKIKTFSSRSFFFPPKLLSLWIYFTFSLNFPNKVLFELCKTVTNSAESQNVQNANLPFTFNSIKMSCSWARLQFYCFWFLLIFFFFSLTNLSFIILLNSSYALKTKVYLKCLETNVKTSE